MYSQKKFKHSVIMNINQELKGSITITPFDILDAFKDIKGT